MFTDTAWDVFITFATAIFDNFWLCCMIIYGLVLARGTWSRLADVPRHERTAQRMPVLKRTAKRFVMICLAWWCGMYVVGYGLSAMDRRAASHCTRITSQQYKNYYVEKCALIGWQYHGRILVRLYASGSNELLAEEAGNDSEYGLYWRNTRTRRHDENGKSILTNEPSRPYLQQLSDPIIEIELPPPWWDRMRAKLP